MKLKNLLEAGDKIKQAVRLLVQDLVDEINPIKIKFKNEISYSYQYGAWDIGNIVLSGVDNEILIRYDNEIGLVPNNSYKMTWYEWPKAIKKIKEGSIVKPNMFINALKKYKWAISYKYSGSNTTFDEFDTVVSLFLRKNLQWTDFLDIKDMKSNNITPEILLHQFNSLKIKDDEFFININLTAIDMVLRALNIPKIKPKEFKKFEEYDDNDEFGIGHNVGIIISSNSIESNARDEDKTIPDNIVKELLDFRNDELRRFKKALKTYVKNRLEYIINVLKNNSTGII
jgi:hypothetical protein